MDLIEQIIDKRYEKLEKTNSHGQFNRQINFYNWFKSMIREEAPQDQNRDVVTEYTKIFTKEMEKKLMDEFRKSKKLEEQLTKQLEQALEKSFSNLNRKFN